MYCQSSAKTGAHRHCAQIEAGDLGGGGPIAVHPAPAPPPRAPPPPLEAPPPPDADADADVAAGDARSRRHDTLYAPDGRHEALHAPRDGLRAPSGAAAARGAAPAPRLRPAPPAEQPRQGGMAPRAARTPVFAKRLKRLFGVARRGRDGAGAPAPAAEPGELRTEAASEVGGVPGGGGNSVGASGGYDREWGERAAGGSSGAASGLDRPSHQHSPLTPFPPTSARRRGWLASARNSGRRLRRCNHARGGRRAPRQAARCGP